MTEKPNPTRPFRSRRIPEKLKGPLTIILRIMMGFVGMFIGIVVLILTTPSANPKATSMDIARAMSACKPHGGIALMVETYNSICADGTTSAMRNSIPEEIMKYYKLLEENRILIFYKIEYETYTTTE